MKKSLRIYLQNSAKVKSGQGFWMKLLNPSLALFILKEAKRAGLQQAISLNINAGYLKDRNLSVFVSETIPRDFPTVLELIDEESILLKFLSSVSDQLSDEYVILENVEELSSNVIKFPGGIK